MVWSSGGRDRGRMCWRGRDRTCNLLIQSQAFCRLNYPPSLWRCHATGRPGSVSPWSASREPVTLLPLMGSLIKKRRKRMRKKKHKKLLRKTRHQRRSKK